MPPYLHVRPPCFIHLPQSGLAILDGRLVKAELIKTLINIIEKYADDNIPPGKTVAEIINLRVGWVVKNWTLFTLWQQKDFWVRVCWYEPVKGFWDINRRMDWLILPIDPSPVFIMMRKVRLIQRTLRAHMRARRTVTLFMGIHKRLRTDPWLDLVLTALCIPELKSLV